MKAQAVFFDKPVAYGRAVKLQMRVHAARLNDKIPDTILFMRHTPVVTLGRRGRDNHLTVSTKTLAKRGIELHVSSRGGDITSHGPGQWVMYPVIRLTGNVASAHGYLEQLEEIAIRTASDFSVDAFRRKGMNGAWTTKGKIAAIGFHIKRWVTLHGMSFNVRTVPIGFELIVPCGLAGERVASLQTTLGENCPAMETVRESLLHHFDEVCQRDTEMITLKELICAYS